MQFQTGQVSELAYTQLHFFQIIMSHIQAFQPLQLKNAVRYRYEPVLLQVQIQQSIISFAKIVRNS